jgi:hypothetical protein
VHCPDIGPILSDGTRVSNLQYADDVTLLAGSPAQLQLLINCAVQYCKLVGLRLSPAKTSIVSFPGNCPAIPWTCDGVPVLRVPSAQYLGLTVHAKHGLLSSCASRERKMWGAWAALQRQYAGLDCGVSLGMLARVHEACIPPVASYGCELWGLRAMPTALAKARKKLSTGHVNMLRFIVGLRKSTPHSLVYLESLGAALSDSWLFRTVTFWNNLGALPHASTFRRIALDSVSQALLGNNNWATSFAQALLAIGYPLQLEQDNMAVIDPVAIRRLLSERRSSVFTPTPDNLDPRTCPSQGVIVCTYARWFQKPPWAIVRTPPLHLPLPPKILRLFFRFRAGCSGLPIDTGRHTRPYPTPRAQRRCLKCTAPSVCDEYHLVFECSALAPHRVQFSSLFTPATQSMLSFMWQKDTCAVALFVARALDSMGVADM